MDAFTSNLAGRFSFFATKERPIVPQYSLCSQEVYTMTPSVKLFPSDQDTNVLKADINNLQCINKLELVGACTGAVVFCFTIVLYTQTIKCYYQRVGRVSV